MDKLDMLINNLGKINVPEIIIDILRMPSILNEISNMVRNRLYLEGTDSYGNKFRTDSAKIQGNIAYAGFTYQSKKRKGQKADNVTFRDTGSFHGSIKSQVPFKTVEITGIFEKDFSHIFDNFRTSYLGEKQFEDAVLGLTEKQKEYLGWEIVYPKLMERINKLISV